MSRPMKILIVLLILLALAAVFLWPRFTEYLEVSACLDAGGSYNYEMSVCDTGDDASPPAQKSP